MLTPHADHLFDRGYLTFEDDGAVLFSPRLVANDLARLGLHTVKTAPFSDRQRAYLSYHRAEIFMKKQ
jgi:hypothetical protein